MRSCLWLGWIAVTAAAVGGSGRVAVADPAAAKPPATRPGVQGNPSAVKFCGSEGHGERIVFVCDATGSMMKSFDLLRVELHKSVDALLPSQSFNIVFYQENAKAPMDTGLLPATQANKRRAFEYIDSYAARRPTDPIPALTAAIAMKPDWIFFLVAPSCYADKPATLELFRTANADKKMKVSTIAWIDRDPVDEKFLKQVAEENGGTFKYISEDDLGK